MGLSLFDQSIYGQEEDEMQDAIVTLSFEEDDESRTIIAKAVDQEGNPIVDLEMYFYVQRTLSLLPIGDDFSYTDDDGIIEVEFPKDLPGDENGNVIIYTKIMDSDLYNDLTLKNEKNWGVPIVIEDPKDEKRSLWAAAANAPMSLIFIVSSLILAVWYVICYIFYKLYRISKIKA
jgi:sensor histidine kinase YesM